MTPEMLAIARDNAPRVAESIGYANVEFRRGRIQDLALDLDLFDATLAADPITDSDGYLRAEERAETLRRNSPMIAEDSIDVVVSNCVLNLVDSSLKPQLFREIHRVLRRGGRAVISDIVSDEPTPEALQKDAELWSGCISGALTEERLLGAFEDAGFYGIRILERQTQPWQTIDGIEFRSLTVEAFKGKEGACWERNQAVIYKGPFKCVLDDDGHRMERGRRYAVCDKTFQIYGSEPYRKHFELVEPRVEIPLGEAKLFDRSGRAERHPRESKGQDYELTLPGNESCSGPQGCC